MVRHPRFELGPSAWKADILAIILMPLFEDFVYYTIFELILRQLNALLIFIFFISKLIIYTLYI